MSVVVFEDHATERLYPITLGRLAYNISCGGYRLCDGLRDLGAPVRSVARPHLLEIERADFSDFAPARHSAGARTQMLVNARVVPSRTNFQTLQQLLKEGRSGVIFDDREAIAAVVLAGDTPPPPLELSVENLPDYFNYARIPSLPPLPQTLTLFDYPHDVIRFHMQILEENLNHRLAQGDYTELVDGVFGAPGARLGEHVVVAPGSGPILLDENATIGPFCFLSGAAYLGKNARVIEHSALKDGVSLGHTTKIGGEVEASVIEPYTNKQHYGFLGHSYLGSWINLGAGTCNSDLKNTYGVVNMEYRGEKTPTGMQFVGCIMGDYAKSAINTGIFTGKVIGSCSMVYGFVTTNVPSFVNYARLFGQVTELPPEVQIATQERMFKRRKVEQRPCDAQLIQDMYILSQHERQLAGEPLSL
ncbi:putative sugar nucleotidyl transferase [Lignipirellula cremea]|uniref:Bifunctional protein GlmU n=1 Tax=Lignipirellula cremea TaxID=2528010 RepID=A0A518E0X6_9BACT|nr:putative sugar nucleotidyl transferase [Lignipirellula cremea]QDU97745.1 Bifunctional protein GlmU [Lignipirellula cremea]